MKPAGPARLLLTCSALAALVLLSLGVPKVEGNGQPAPAFQDLGIPVTTASLLNYVVAPGYGGVGERFYVSSFQTGASFLLLSIDVQTGQCDAFHCPVESETGCWALAVGHDGKVYCGSLPNAYLLRFDPVTKEFVSLGQPCEGEQYIWSMATAPDGRIYGATYPSARLCVYDPATGESKDLGRMDPEEQYNRHVAIDDAGFVYSAIGPARQAAVVYDPRIGEHRDVTPDEFKVPGFAYVYRAPDGHAYVQLSGKYFRAEGFNLTPVDASSLPSAEMRKLADGHNIWLSGEYTFTISDPATGASEVKTFHYKSDGAPVFSLALGPDGCIYGSSAMPLHLFRYNPESGEMEDLGKASVAGGEIYSMQSVNGKLFMAAYGGANLSVYDPLKPWHFGETPSDNPRHIGSVGESQDRPVAMILGPRRKIYLGSVPGYGLLGGAVAVLDPRTYTVKAFRNLVPNQTIYCLAYHKPTGLIVGGSGTFGGGGSHPTEKEAHLFLWDPEQEKVVFDCVPVPDAGTIVGVVAARDGLVYAAANEDNDLFAFDPKTREIVWRGRLPWGAVRMNSFTLGPDGSIYGVAGDTAFRFDPRTREAESLGTYPSLHLGPVIADGWMYFGAGVHLIRLPLPHN